MAGGRYLVLPSGTLLIANSTRRHSGSYRCAAYNPVADVRSTSPITHRVRVTPTGQSNVVVASWSGGRIIRGRRALPSAILGAGGWYTANSSVVKWENKLYMISPLLQSIRLFWGAIGVTEHAPCKNFVSPTVLHWMLIWPPVILASYPHAFSACWNTRAVQQYV